MVTSVSDEHAELLSQLTLFRGLDRVALAKVAGHLEPLAVLKGTAICVQGEVGDELYLISRGAFGVYARASVDADEVLLNLMRRGDAIGEIALLTNEPRSATVRALEDSEVLRLPQRRFLELIRRDPSVGLAITAALIKRLRAADVTRLGAGDGATLPRPDPGPRSDAVVASRPATPRSWTGRRTLGLLLSTLLFAVGWWAMPPPADLGAPGWRVLISLIAVLPMLALEAVPDGVIALLLVAVWVVGAAAPVRIALGGFSSSLWVLLVAVFAVGAAIASSGLLYRLALWAVTRTSSYRAQVITLGVSGAVFGSAVPNATGRMSLIASAVNELADALGLEPGSDFAAGLAMAALVGYGLMVAPFLTSSSVALLAFALLPETARADLTWATWAIRAAPLHLVLLVGMLAVVLWGSSRGKAHRPRQGLERVIALQRAVLGRASHIEVLVGLITAALLVGLATQSLHGLDPAWVAAGAFVAMAATGAITVDTLRAINWSTVLLLGMFAGIGDVFTATRLDAWLGSILVGSVGSLASIRLAFVLGVALLCMALSLVVRWQAAVPIIVVALSGVAGRAGIDPWVVAIITLTASNTFFLPYQSTIYLTLHSGTAGRLFRHSQARPLSVAYAVLVLIGLGISVPFWHALGLL